MKETLEAVYENGGFRPLRVPTGLGPYRGVTLTVTARDEAGSLIGRANRISLEDAREMREIIDRDIRARGSA